MVSKHARRLHTGVVSTTTFCPTAIMAIDKGEAPQHLLVRGASTTLTIFAWRAGFELERGPV